MDTDSKGKAENAVKHQGIEHVGLSVADLDRSLAFYRDLLGLKVVRIIEDNPQAKLGEIVGMPGAIARIAHLESAGSMLELFEYQNPLGKEIPKDRTQADHGFIHIGFKVHMQGKNNVAAILEGELGFSFQQDCGNVFQYPGITNQHHPVTHP